MALLVVTGAASGLGRFIHERLGGIGLTRKNGEEQIRRLRREGADTIVHCAFNSARHVGADTLYGYLDDNVLLTARLAEIPHRKFIFISTLDIYPKDGRIHTETDDINVDQVRGIYGVSKLMSEAIVRRRCPNHLILRVSGLLGEYSRRYSLIRIIENDGCVLTLSRTSRFNYVLHSSVFDVVAAGLAGDLAGTYNVVSRGDITLGAVADMLGRSVTFGEYEYDAGDIDNRKIAAQFPVFNKTSKDIVLEYMSTRYGIRIGTETPQETSFGMRLTGARGDGRGEAVTEGATAEVEARSSGG